MPSLDPADRAEIADLLSAYSYGYDQQQWDLYRSIWADDAVLTTPAAAHRTPAAIEEHARAWRGELAARGIQTRHYQTNTRFEALQPGKGDGDGDRVRARTMLLVLWQHDGRPAPEPMHTGVYDDEYVRTPTGWRLASRAVRIDHD